MLVRMCSIMAGPVYGNARYGDLVDFPTEVAQEMIKQRHAMAYVAEVKTPKAKKEDRRGRRPGREDATRGGSDHADRS